MKLTSKYVFPTVIKAFADIFLVLVRYCTGTNCRGKKHHTVQVIFWHFLTAPPSPTALLLSAVAMLDSWYGRIHVRRYGPIGVCHV